MASFSGHIYTWALHIKGQLMATVSQQNWLIQKKYYDRYFLKTAKSVP